jgi:hypothetical protein
VWTVAWGTRCHGFFGARGLEGSRRAAFTWLRGKIREGSKARAGRRSRRRDGQTLGCECAGGGTLRPAAAATSSKTGAGNVMSVCTWVTRDIGQRTPGGAEDPKRGAVVGEV